MNSRNGNPETGTVLYRLEIAGCVDAGWSGWLEAERVTAVGENTVLEVRVSDQAELYGRLRQIHNLNLRLLSLACVSPGGRVHDGNDPSNQKPQEVSK